ncbi:GMC oxidoreductase [Luteitalea sp.]|uniref:GMC oxidoreductase n=1 Tax=Luteitalea sp. TaxID=2004800 RepID=UPI0037C5C38E
MSASEVQGYDLVIVGSGAGGGTVAHALASTGLRILVLERGGEVPSEPENWDPAAVWKSLRYRATERWLDGSGQEFQPYTHYNVGGNTKYWGSVLYRLRREDFGEIAHRDGVSPAWPISYEDLAPWYERAERLYHVHGDATGDSTEPPRGPFPHPPVPHAPAMQQVIEGLRAQGLHPSSLPLGLVDPGLPGGCQLCNTCNSFPCRIHRKGDADVCCVRPAVQAGVTLWTHARATRVLTSADGTRVTGVEVERQGALVRVEAPRLVLSCGAVNSAALLLRSATAQHPRGLANSSGLIGRRYMAHLATMMQGFHPFRRNDTVFQKTVAINDFYLRGPGVPYPLGQIQSQGRTHGIMAKVVGDTWFRGTVTWVPVWAYDAWVARGVDWLAMSEDLPNEDNRVTLTEDGRIRLTYTPNNEGAHAQLVREAIAMLKRLGYWKVMTASHRAKNTTHQCGTLVFGHDPARSVLDTFCRTHDVPNLFVVDGSFFPSSAAVNPGLTIIAQALRVADHLRRTELRRPEDAATGPAAAHTP